jgi:protein-S-isoprenylcysteine O-methyltransferase Ste14
VTADEPAPAAGAVPRWAVAAGRFFFRWRDALFPAVLLLIVLVSPPGLRFASRAWDRALDLAGVAVALAGQALRILVIGLAYIRRGGLDRRIHADALVVEGFFAHSRNPLYLGNLLGLAGFCLIHDSALGYLVGLPFFALAYWTIVVAEEEFLRARFGAAYEAYRRRVPRFVPSWRGLRGTLRGMRFDWRRVVSKEYGTTFAGLSLVLLLLAWDGYRRWGAAGAAPTLRWGAVLWAPLVVAYLAARTLKKSGRLATPSAETTG